MKLRIPKISKSEPGDKKSFSVFSVVKDFRKGFLVLQRRRQEEEGKGQNIFMYAGGAQGGMAVPYPVELKVGEMRIEGATVKAEKGIEISMKDMRGPLRPPMTPEEREMLQNVNMSYPLIPPNPKKSERVFAYANIKWDPKQEILIYSVIEPFISDRDRETIEEIKRVLEEKLDVNFAKIGEIKAKELLSSEVKKLLEAIEGMSPDKREIFQYYIERDVIGLGRIEPFMRDREIEDVSCDGEKIPLYVYHRNPQLGSMKTNVIFNDKEELDTFVMRISQKCEKSISVAEPLIDGSLPDGSRIQATLGTDIAMKGSNFTVRKFTEEPLTPIHMLEYGTMDSTQLAYMWLAVENRKSILISGGTATGKTSLLNALSLFIHPALKVVSIEDTPELRLPLPHWVPEVARTPLSVGGGKIGEVSLFDLLKESLRQRPDYIIVGEVRGKEAFVLFQQIATGHAGLATIHSASISQLVDRLTTPPISLSPTLIENIDIIIFLMLAKIRSKYVRRANEIIEVIGIKDDKPLTVQVFKWKPVGDEFETVKKSVVLESIAYSLGMTEDSLKEEMRRRKAVLEYMHEKGIFDYIRVAKIINGYYSDPEKIINMIEETS